MSELNMAASNFILSNIYFCGKTNLMDLDFILPNIYICGRTKFDVIGFHSAKYLVLWQNKIWRPWIPFFQIFPNMAEWNLVASDPICSNIYFYGRIKYGITLILLFQIFIFMAEFNLALSDSILPNISFCGRTKSDVVRFHSFKYLLLWLN
jgi:hypothetical protein